MINTSQLSVFLPARKAISLGPRKSDKVHIQLQPIIPVPAPAKPEISPYTISTKFNIRKKYHTEPKRSANEGDQDLYMPTVELRKPNKEKDLKLYSESFELRRKTSSKVGTNRVHTEKAVEQSESSEQRQVNRNNHLRTIYGIKNSSRRKVVSPDPELQELTSPISGDLCIHKYKRRLATIQKDEIRDQPTIYYLGKRRPQVVGFGYAFDDDEGDLKVYAHDQIAYRYEVLAIIGKGSFGQVFKAFDHKTKELVALKIIKNKPKYTAQAQVQTRLLKQITSEDRDKSSNIIEIKDSTMFRGHVCITFELLHQNLYEFIKQNKFNGFSVDLIRRVSIQILKALLFLNKLKIIHCDLKPENVLLKQENKSGIKVIDLGSSCKASQIMYTYIQSRFYRAPEIILGIDYTPAIDMWSFGCILCELYTGQPVFPGQDESEQIGMFVQLLGLPPKSMVDRAKRKKFFQPDGILKPFPSGKTYKPNSKSVKSHLMCKDKSFVELVQRCLEWDPSRRIRPSEALLHKWIVDALPADVRSQHIDFMRKDGYEVAD